MIQYQYYMHHKCLAEFQVNCIFFRIQIELQQLEWNATSVSIEARIIGNDDEHYFRLTTDRDPQIWP